MEEEAKSNVPAVKIVHCLLSRHLLLSVAVNIPIVYKT
jgi:hypothetical protein